MGGRLIALIAVALAFPVAGARAQEPGLAPPDVVQPADAGPPVDPEPPVDPAPPADPGTPADPGPGTPTDPNPPATHPDPVGTPRPPVLFPPWWPSFPETPSFPAVAPPDRPRTRCDFTTASRASAPGTVFGCDFPDPMVLRVGSTYYAYSTATRWEPGDSTFPILRSTDLRHWQRAGDALTREPAWSDGHMWAPSVLAARGRYYLYYSARRRSDGLHCLAVATATTPAGPFADRGVIRCRDGAGAGFIDPAPLIDRGKAYLFFSVDGPRHSISMLTLTRDLLRARGGRRTLFGVRRSWHRGLADETVEAPFPVRRGKRFYLFYSAGCWCSDYRMGWAVADRPQGPYRDGPHNPVLSGTAQMLAPGGGSVVTRPGGSSVLLFHAWKGVPAYDAGGMRTLHSAPVRWGRDGPTVRMR